MLGRSLWEDMLVAHWIKLNPDVAPRQLDDHRRMTLALYQGELRRFGLDVPDAEPLDRTERDRLKAEFGSRHWTKLSMDALCNEVATEFPEEEGHRRLLRQVDALLHRHANLIVHNSFLSIGGAFSSIGDDGRMTFDVGVSTRFSRPALLARERRREFDEHEQPSAWAALPYSLPSANKASLTTTGSTARRRAGRS